jgi:hypothetical protein
MIIVKEVCYVEVERQRRWEDGGTRDGEEKVDCMRCVGRKREDTRGRELGPITKGEWKN